MNRLRRGDAHQRGLEVDELRRLHRAELAITTAPSASAAAEELAGHALALLGAPVVVVLVDGPGGTTSVVRGDGGPAAVDEPGSRMRLLDDDGTPVGSIAVAPRADGLAYDERDDDILDTLAQRASATLPRLSRSDAVQAERAALADVLDSSVDAICAIGPDLRVQSWNAAMVEASGVAAEVAVGQPCCAVLRPVAEDGSPRHGSACPCRSNRTVAEVLRLDPASAVRWFEVSFSPRSGGGTVVVARDVTERKRLDDEKADFVATVSHELRTPLTPLKGFLQMLARRGDELTSEERQQVHELLLREEERLEQLVDQLLRATALERHRTVEPRPFDARGVADARVEWFRSSVPDREVHVVGAEAAGALGDREATSRVLDDLLSNAAKYTPAGSPIGVRVTTDAVTGWTTIVVEDHGEGIPEPDRERVFDRFTRLGDHVTQPQQGVGLGLYIVRQTVAAMGGTVRCDASATGGAAFVVQLPACELPVATPP